MANNGYTAEVVTSLSEIIRGCVIILINSVHRFIIEERCVILYEVFFLTQSSLILCINYLICPMHHFKTGMVEVGILW